MLHFKCTVSIVILTMLNIVQTANILALFPLQAPSHFRVYRVLLEKLAERGHTVDVLSHFPRESPLSGYTDINVSGSVPFITDYPVESIKSMTALNVLQVSYEICGRNLCEAIANTTAAKQLMKKKTKYDIIIIEMFVTDCLLGYAHIFKAPIIAMISSMSWPWSADFTATPDNPSYIPNYFAPYTENMNFLQRLHNAVVLYTSKFWYHYYALEENNRAIESIFGRNEVHVKDILRNISLLMVNTHFSLQQSRPMTSNFIEVGGMHIQSNVTLPSRYEHYMQTNLDGVVLVSFGSHFKSGKFPDIYIMALFDTLKEIPYKVLWKGDVSDVPKHIEVPKNVHFISWLPQVEILCHPNLKLFITHSGLGGLQETIRCGKPILAIPVWADQMTNAHAATSKGIGTVVPFFEINKLKIADALKELLGNPQYGENAKKLSKLFLDRPMSALDTAVYWTEYVIRHNGAPHLRSKAVDLPWFTYYCVDIILVVSIVVFLLLALLYRLLSILRAKVYLRVYQLLRNMSKTKEQ